MTKLRAFTISYSCSTIFVRFLSSKFNYNSTNCCMYGGFNLVDHSSEVVFNITCSFCVRFMQDHATSALIWNYKTREELREALENEIRSFTVDKVQHAWYMVYGMCEWTTVNVRI